MSYKTKNDLQKSLDVIQLEERLEMVQVPAAVEAIDPDDIDIGC